MSDYLNWLEREYGEIFVNFKVEAELERRFEEARKRWAAFKALFFPSRRAEFDVRFATLLVDGFFELRSFDGYFNVNVATQEITPSKDKVFDLKRGLLCFHLSEYKCYGRNFVAEILTDVNAFFSELLTDLNADLESFYEIAGIYPANYLVIDTNRRAAENR